VHSDSKRTSTTVLLLRHGQTDYPKNRYYDDKIEDPSLNLLGIRQAGLWVTQFKKEPRALAAIYASPSRRTQETAGLASSGLNLPIETEEGLKERDFGVWGGLTSSEIQNRFPEDWAKWRSDTLGFTPEGGESLRDFSRRITEMMEALVSRHQNRCFLAVSHVGPIRMMVANALEIPLFNVKRLVIRNASMTEIEYTTKWPNLHALSFVPDSTNEEM